MREFLPSRRTMSVAPMLLVVGCLGLFAVLLALYPYHGLYGQDSFAYYYQARALWQEMSGRPGPPDQLFSAEALRWPVGYHLHIVAGILLTGGPEGGRAITLGMTAILPAFVYLIVGEVWTGVSSRVRIAAGLLAAAILPLCAIYTRMGLSLMSDVPAVFWSVLAVYCCLRAWPPLEPRVAGTQTDRQRLVWAGLTGLTLGIAVLVRYGSVLLFGALLLYILVRRLERQPGPGGWRRDMTRLAAVAAGLMLGIVPQVMYLATHTAVAQPGAVDYRVWLSGWSFANMFATTLTSSDGVATYPYPNIVFYMLEPLWTLGAGLLSPFYIPALLVGLWTLARTARWAVLTLLLGWWVLPALFFSGSPYQSQRFVIAYLPALALLIGIGCGVALQGLLGAHWRRLSRTAAPALLRVAVIACTCGGLLVGLGLTAHWVGVHAAFEAEDRRVAELVREAAGSAAGGGTPHVISFNITAAVYHYTGFDMLDFYNHDEDDIARFVQGSGPRVIVLPEQSMSTQWANTPSAARWNWIRASYNLHLAGTVDEYSIYTIEGNR